MKWKREVVSAIVTERGARDDVIDRANSFACMFAARSASVFPPRGARPNVVAPNVGVRWVGRLGRVGRAERVKRAERAEIVGRVVID